MHLKMSSSIILDNDNDNNDNNDNNNNDSNNNDNNDNDEMMIIMIIKYHNNLIYFKMLQPPTSVSEATVFSDSNI